MSQFETRCPNCGAPLAGQDEWIGMNVECPQCQQEFTLQAPKAEAPAARLRPCPFCGNEIAADSVRCKFCKKDLRRTGSRPSISNRPSAPARQDTQAFQLRPCPFCGNEIAADSVRCKFCKKDLRQTGNRQYVPAVPFRKKRRNIILIAGAFILLSAGIIFLVCNNIVSSAMADAERLVSSRYNCPDGSVLAYARVRLDEINEKYWFVFARSRTEELCARLEKAETVVAAVSEGEMVLRNRQYAKFRETSDKLKQIAVKYPFEFSKRQIDDLIKRLNAHIPSREAIKILKINDPAEKPQLTINKTINPRNDWSLCIFTMDRKKDVAAIFGKIGDIGRNFQRYKQHSDEGRRLSKQASIIQPSPTDVIPDASYVKDRMDAWHTSMELRKRAVKQFELAKPPLLQAGACHEEAAAWLVKEGIKAMEDIPKGTMSMISVPLTSNICNLSNVRGPVILLAVEMINYGDGFSSYQGWYKEYEPAADAETETWTLN